MKAHR